jgi:hypothetical protein
MSGGGKTQTSTQQVAIPPEVLARYNSINARAEGVAGTPFQQYGGQFVAPVNAQQQLGIAGINNAANSAQPYFGAATGLTAAGAGAVNPGELQTQRYMNPYTENVVNATRRGLEQQQGQQASQQQADAIRGGAFGGDRAGIQRAVLQGQQELATAQAIEPLYRQGYSQALQTGQQQQGVNLAADQANAARYLQAGQQFAGLGAQQQQSQLAGAQAQIGAGTLQQQTEQADTAARYQQFLQERGYPFQVAQFLANIGMGTGALSGSTTTTTQPGPFFSDEREKTNIKPLGEGQYAYDYIDDVERAERTGSPMPPKRVGPMAQDIERSDPGQVIDVNGYKVVNPTGESYSGGLAGGGYVDEPGAYDRGGYAPGGLVDAVDLRAILAAQQQFLGPYAGQGGPYGGQKQGQPGFVPQASLPVPKLATAGNLSQPRPSGLSEAAQTGSQLAGLAKTGSDAFGKGREWLSSGKPQESAGPRVINQSGAVAAGLGAPRESAGAAAGLSSAPVRVSDLEGATPTLASRGGLMPHGYAMGGMPYGGDPTLQGVLDEGDQQIRQLPKPGQAPGAAKGLGSDLMDAAKLGTSLYSMGSTAATAAAAAPEALVALMVPFSDQRLKHNIDPVGETYDGQQIYRYDMGDGRTQLGLMAQEVAQRKPDAVGERNGFLTLDYDRATEDAVPRAYGGLVPRQGYQQGGPPEDFIERVIASEWGGKDPQELRGIAAVINNRARQRGLSPMEVVLEEGQFEPVSNVGGKNDPMRHEPGSPRLRAASEAWKEIQGGAEDPTGGASHFYGPKSQAALGRQPPKWSAAPGLTIGDTSFHRVDTGGPAAKPEGLGAAAPNPPQVTAGLGAAAPNPPRATGVIPPEEIAARSPIATLLGGMFGDNMKPETKQALKSENLWVPLIAGVGSMLASKSPYLGTAIGEGLVGGTSAYTGLQKQQSESDEAKARTALADIQAATGAIIKDSAGRPQYVVVSNGRGGTRYVPFYLVLNNPNDYNLTPQTRAAMEQAARDATQGGTPPPATDGTKTDTPTGAPPPGRVEVRALPPASTAGEPPASTAGEPSKPIRVGAIEVEPGSQYRVNVSPSPDADRYFSGTEFHGVDVKNPDAIQNIIRLNPTLATRAESEQKTADEARARSRSAERSINDIWTLGSSLNKISDDKFGQTGAGQETRASYLNLYNTIVRVGGAPGAQIDPGSDVDASQIIKKIQALSSPEVAQRLGFNASGIAQAIQSAMPSGNMNKDAANTILASMLQEIQRDRDFNRYYDAYSRRYGTALNVEDAFKRDMGDVYAEERKHLKDAFTAYEIETRDGDKVVSTRKSAADILRENPRAARQFDTRFNMPGLARYWGAN